MGDESWVIRDRETVRTVLSPITCHPSPIFRSGDVDRTIALQIGLDTLLDCCQRRCWLLLIQVDLLVGGGQLVPVSRSYRQGRSILRGRQELLGKEEMSLVEEVGIVEQGADRRQVRGLGGVDPLPWLPCDVLQELPGALRVLGALWDHH